MSSDDIATQNEDAEDPTTHKKLIELLEKASIEVKKLHHKPVKTSEEASLVRGFPLECGAKAIVLSLKYKATQPGPQFGLFVMSATKKLDSKKIRSNVTVGCRSISFASPEQVKELTGCIPGAVPPFGSLWNIQTYMDESLQKFELIDFNSGLRTDSVRMKQMDYENLEKPVICCFTIAE